MNTSKQTKTVFYIGAFLSFIISFIIFFKTMAPTLSFWDCGEFVASSYTLGVPHPPGTPMYILIGKFFMILGILSTPALNTNIISVLSSALTAMMAYLIIVKVSRKIIDTDKTQDNTFPLYGIFAGALSGSLIMAFSSTFWFNAVETEVYGLSMMIMAVITYMSLCWSENLHKAGNDKLLVGIAYILFLSISIHLTTFLLIPAIVAYIAFVDHSKLRDWRFWVSWGILFSFAMPVYIPIQLMFPALMNWQLETWFVLMLAFAAISGYKTFNARGKSRQAWGLYFAIMLAGIIGFTPHIYIPIRSIQKPAINENDPSNWPKLKSYLERKQYGQESMVTRMFTRRAKLSHQFGDYPHMGFWGYFKDQYSNDIWGMLRYLPFLIGLFGMYISLRKTFKNGFLLAAIFLISSLGLILYLNFADGTKVDHLEVRDRDYFFTPAFMYFAIIIGVGLSTLLANIPAWLNKRMAVAPTYLIWVAALIVTLLLPVDTLTHNYRTHDRTGDYAPYDYAYNILTSCDQDAILFTNGDNDTFPLWYIQEVENFRKDIRIVNLSLLNTDWYILQLKHEMNVPINLTDEQIIWEPFERQGQIQIYRPAEPYYDPYRKQNHYLVPFQDPKTRQVLRVQDQMIEHILLANKWKYPIYFSTSVPESNRARLDDYTLRQGMVLRIMPDKPKFKVDTERTEELLLEIYKYRGVDDLSVFKDENNVGLTSTYPERFINLSNFYVETGDTLSSKRILFESLKRFPLYYQTYIELITHYEIEGNTDSSQVFFDKAVESLKEAIEVWPEMTLYYQYLGEINYRVGKNEDALKIYQQAWELDPSSKISAYRLIYLYAANGQPQDGLNLLNHWLAEHPSDMYARQLSKIFRNQNR